MTYAYDSNGALATTEDSKTGRTTKYYYDTVGRISGRQEKSSDKSHSIGYTYDALGNVSAVTESYDGQKRTTTYEYDGANRVRKLISGSTTEEYTYDAFSRLDDRLVYHGNSTDAFLTKRIGYENHDDERATSNYISVWTVTSTAGYSVNYNIFYDGNGNITSVKCGSNTTSYVYDSANQLVRENNQEAGKTWVWTYDEAGNITSKKEYAYTTGSLGAIIDTISYTYDNSAWGDLLTEYDGAAISYDAIGNITSDANWGYSWSQGRQLSSMFRGSVTWSFAYDSNGMRTGRTSGSTVYTYVYNGSQLSRMTYGSNTLLFTYGADGSPLSLTYNGTTYYYVVNLQGDVVAILNSSGAKVVSYTYDAWGRLLTTSVVGTANSNLALHNPLRYRGYVYDRETGLYYLQSRYYNPTIGRFINADNLVNPGAGIWGNNMFAYCSNNPTVRVDYEGQFWDYVVDVGFLIWSVVDVVNDPGDWKNWAALGVDTVFAVVPFVPSGAGQVIKVGNKIDNAVDVANAINKVDNLQDTAKVTMIGRNMDSVTSTAKLIGKADNLYDTWKGYDIAATGMKKFCTMVFQ